MLPIRSLLFVLILFPFSVFAQNENTWSLQESLQYAQENNLTLQQAKLNIERYEALYNQSKFSFLPSLNADANHNYNFGRSVDPTTYTFSTGKIITTSIGASSNLILFGGFRKWNTLKQSQFDLQASQYGAAEIFNDIAIDIVQAYLQVLLNQEQLVISENQVTISEAQLQNMERLVRAGSVPEGNLLELEAQIANDRFTVINVKNQLNIALLNLQLLLNLEPSPEFNIEKPTFNATDFTVEELESPETIFQQAVNSQPGIKRAELEVASAEKGVDVAKGNYYPTLSLYGSLNTSYSDARTLFEVVPAGFDTIGAVATTGELVLRPAFNTQPVAFPFSDQLDENFNQNVGLRLSIPIFNQFQTRTNVTLAKINQNSAQINLAQERQALKTEVYQAHANALASLQQYQAALVSLQAAEQSFDYIQKRYDTGLIRTIEYTVAQNNLQVARFNLVRAKYEYILTNQILDLYKDNQINIK